MTCESIATLECKAHILRDVLLPLWVNLLYAPGTAQYLLQPINHLVSDIHCQILLELDHQTQQEQPATNCQDSREDPPTLYWCRTRMWANNSV